MVGNRDVVLALLERGETNVTTALPSDAIAEILEGPR